MQSSSREKDISWSTVLEQLGTGLLFMAWTGMLPSGTAGKGTAESHPRLAPAQWKICTYSVSLTCLANSCWKGNTDPLNLFLVSEGKDTFDRIYFQGYLVRLVRTAGLEIKKPHSVSFSLAVNMLLWIACIILCSLFKEARALPYELVSNWSPPENNRGREPWNWSFPYH